MFWGVTLMPGRRYTQTVEKAYHISKACFQLPKDAKEPKRADVLLHQDSAKFLLCSLNNQKSMTTLDLMFTEGEQVTFSLEGDGPVHLTGYLMDFGDDELSDVDSDLSDLVEEDEEEEAPVAKEIAVKRKPEGSPVEAKKLKVDDKTAKAATPVAKVNGNAVAKTANAAADSDEEDDEELGLLDEEDDDDEELSDEEEDEEDDEEEEEEDEEEEVSPKPKVAKPVINGQAKPGKQQQQQQQQAQKPKQGVSPQQQQNKSFGQNQNKFGGQGQNKFGGQGKFGGAGGNQFNKSPQGGQNKFGGNKFQQRGSGAGAGGNQGKFGGGQNKFGNKKFGGGERSFGSKNKESESSGGESAAPPGGLVVKDVHPGAGPVAKKGKFVHVRYVGRLPNNKEFDRSGNKPFSFRLGAGDVIKGWDVGLEGMKVGGKRKISVPPNMGYGSRSMGPIPANSTLNFEVELVSVS